MKQYADRIGGRETASARRRHRSVIDADTPEERERIIAERDAAGELVPGVGVHVVPHAHRQTEEGIEA